jgi:RNA polymerase sigma-70 factor, ECF subfamily
MSAALDEIFLRLQRGESPPSRINSDWATAFRLSKSTVHGMLFRFGVRDEETRAELMQETMTRAYRALASFRWQSSAQTWLVAIAKNVTYEHLRRQIETLDIHEIDDGTNEPHAAFTANSEPIEFDRDCVRQQLARFCEDYPEHSGVIGMLIVDGASYDSIAERVGRTVAATRQMIAYARARLRERMRVCFAGTFLSDVGDEDAT